jgi:hypothetical protein
LAWVQSARVNEAFFAISVEASVAIAGVGCGAVNGQVDGAAGVDVTAMGSGSAVVWDAERDIAVEIEEVLGAGADVAVTISGAVSVISARVGSAGVEEADFLGSLGGAFNIDGGLVVTFVAGPECVALGVDVAGSVLGGLGGEAGVVARVLSVVIGVVVDEASLASAGEVPASDFCAICVGTASGPVGSFLSSDDVSVHAGDDGASWWAVGT